MENKEVSQNEIVNTQQTKNAETAVKEDSKRERYSEQEWLTDEELAKKRKRQEIFDKITTGLLIFLMCTPFLILAYIIVWFLTK